MKKIIPIILVICLVFTLFACTAETDASSESGIPAEIEKTLTQSNILEGKKLGFAHISTKDDWVTELSVIFPILCDYYGAECVYYNAENNSELQNEQLNKLINEKCDIIFIDPVSPETHNDSLKAANDAGIPVIVYDNPWTNPAGNIAATVKWDQYASGQMAASYLVDYVENNNCENTVYVLGITCSLVPNFKEKFDGFRDTIETSGSNIQIADIIDTDLTEEAAEELVSSVNLIYDVVIAPSDTAAMGTLNAFRQNDDSRKIISMGGYGETCFPLLENNDENYLAAVTNYPWVLAQNMFTAAIDCLEGNEIEDEININQYIVDASNVSEINQKYE